MARFFSIIALTCSLAGLPISASSGELVRIGAVPFKAEVTGIVVNHAGELFFNAQHPEGKGELVGDGPAAFIGYVPDVNFNDYTGDGIAVPPAADRNRAHAPGRFVTLARTGDQLGDGRQLGGVYTRSGDLMFLSNDVDYNAFVPIDDESALLYTAFEGASRKGVSAISRLHLVRDGDRWRADLSRSRMIDLTSIEGAWVLCFGSTTPWGSELLAEEYYFFNTALWNHPANHNDDERPGFAGGDDVTYHMPKMMDRYLGRTSNPYRYGYMIEMSDVQAAQPLLTRHYAMGRFSHENGAVMGDGRTVYLSDDDSPKYTSAKYNSNSGGVLFKFVADRARDLSSGTLYAARAIQDSGNDPFSTGFDLEWIELAQGDNATIERWVSEYEGITPEAYRDGETNFVSDLDVWNWAEGRSGKDLNGDGTVGSYPDDRPAFLESRKAAAALGATYEWNKMEGITADGTHVYLAISEVGISMDKDWGHAPWHTGARDKSDPGAVSLLAEPCGGVYRARIEHDYNISRLEPAYMGKSTDAGCDPNRIANPDNIASFAGGLLIAEDAGPKMHPVDMLWLVRH